METQVTDLLALTGWRGGSKGIGPLGDGVVWKGFCA